MNESTTKILTRKKVQNNPELRDQLIDLGNIDPFKSKSKITRSPPKESNIYENLPESSNTSATLKISKTECNVERISRRLVLRMHVHKNFLSKTILRKPINSQLHTLL